MRINEELDGPQLYELRQALTERGEALQKLVKKSEELGIPAADAEAHLAVIFGLHAAPGLVHLFAEWKPVPNPDKEQSSIFALHSGPWVAEQSSAGARVRNDVTGEVKIVPTPELAWVRAVDLNTAHADRRESDSRKWTSDEP